MSHELHLPALGSISETLDIPMRLITLGISHDDELVASRIWEIIKPEAKEIATAHWDCWSTFFPNEADCGDQEKRLRIDRCVSYIEDRLCNPENLEWVRSAERTVARAFSSEIPLTAILAMTCAGASKTLETLGRRVECSKEERQRITDVLFRLRSLECDVYGSLYNSYVEHRARAQRDVLAVDFAEGVAQMVDAASRDGSDLKQKSVKNLDATRGMLGQAFEVSAAAEESALAMREAAQTAGGLIRAIEEARGEVEIAAGIATRASEQSGRAVKVSEALSGHAKAIESILSLIRDIAGQTNLLALNATIEAARAGDAGRGFAVVAQEVKSLASQTARATDDIAAKIAAIQAATKQTVEANGSIRETVGEVQSSAARIQRVMEAQAHTVTMITAAVDETALAADKMSANITAIRNETEVVAAGIETVGAMFDGFEQGLLDLKWRAGDFAKKVAA